MGANSHISPVVPTRLQPVVALLRKKLHVKQIARQLGLSVYTINTYAQQIYDFYGVKDRIELMALWLEEALGEQQN